MIVKVQRPLSASEPNPPLLVYDQERTHRWFLALTRREVRKLLGDDPKRYFEAEIVAGNPALGERVADQPW